MNLLQKIENTKNAKLWEKNDIKRFYLNEKALLELLDDEYTEFNPLSDFELKKIKKAKAYYCLNSNKIFCDTGVVRTRLNTSLECKIEKI